MEIGRCDVPTERIFLIGMMGCGKSTVGDALSHRIGCPYLDNDAVLAAREGLDLLGLAHEGAERLHDAEAAVADAVARRRPPFVAGIAASVVERPEPVARLRSAGFVVYLRARPETLLRRVRSGARPWLDEDPLGWLTRTLERREPLFQQAAHLVVDTDDTPPDELAARIERASRGVQRDGPAGATGAERGVRPGNGAP